MPGFHPSDEPATQTVAWPHRPYEARTTFAVKTTPAPLIRQEAALDGAQLMGDQTCGYVDALQSTVTCSNEKGQIGYCTNVGEYRGCCWGPGDLCSVTMPTTCIGSTAMGALGGSSSVACPQGAQCCTRDDSPACVAYNYVTGTDVFTYYGCGTADMVDNMTPMAAAPALASSAPITTADVTTISGQVTASIMLSSTTQDPQASSRPGSTGKIVGGVVGGAVGFCIIVAVGLFVFCRRQRRKEQPLVISRPFDVLKPGPEEDEVQQTSSGEDHNPTPANPSPTIIPSPQMVRTKYQSFRRSYGPLWPLGHGDPLESHPLDVEKRLSVHDHAAADNVPQIQLPSLPGAVLSQDHSPSGRSRKPSVAPRSPHAPTSGMVVPRSPSTHGGVASASPISPASSVGVEKQNHNLQTMAGVPSMNGVEGPRPVSPLEEDEIGDENSRISLISMPSIPRQSVLLDGLVSPISPDQSTRDERQSFATVSPIESRRSSMTETGVETGVEARRVTLGQIKEINIDRGQS